MFDKEYLFDILKKNNSQEFISLAKKMNVRRDKNKEFSNFLFKLVQNGEIIQTKNRKYFLPEFIGEFEGEIRITPKGMGFVDLDEENSAFIPAIATKNSMNSDLVKIKFFNDPFMDGAKQGIVVEVIKRNISEFVGEVKKFGANFGIVPFNNKIIGKFRFKNNNDLKEGMQVKVKILQYGNFHILEIKKIIGLKGDAKLDIMAAIEDSGVIHDFFPATLMEAKKIPSTIDGENIDGRIDLRNELIYTIDGDDTKDFDDAISVKELKNGNMLLGVHIADVTHYVKEDNPLDKEALARGTSIYLVDRVIPMLPEKLSNGICSLNPNVDRFTITADMEIDSQGNTVKTNIYPSIINSKHRLTYQEVNEFVEEKKEFDQELTHSLRKALKLSKILREFKQEEGYIDFEIEEAKIKVDEKGVPIEIVPRERSFSEIMIEDFMVRANETVAKFIFDMELPFIYRVHAIPNFEKITSLQSVINTIGIKVNIPQSPNPKAFSNAINEIKKKRFDDFIKIMMLRTMAKAEYSDNNIGHFGLASQHYTHFTSPIRRYPDLMVHRMLREYLFKNNKKSNTHFQRILPEIAEHSSQAEQVAVVLERKVADIKKAEYYEKLIGQEFEGTIVSVLKFGFFVEFPNKTGGLVHISSLLDGDYSLKDDGLSLASDKRKFLVGDKIKVKILNADKSAAKVDLAVSDLYEKAKQKTKRYNN